MDADVLRSENRSDRQILRAVVDHLEVVEVVELIGRVLQTVNAEGDHVVLRPAGLGHGDRYVIAVGYVELRLEVKPVDVGQVVKYAGNPVDGDLPQAQASQIMTGLIHALHGDHERLGIKDGLDVHAGGGHLEGKRIGIGMIESRYSDCIQLQRRAVILAHDKQFCVILGRIELVAVAGSDNDHHRIVGLSGVRGFPGGRYCGSIPALVADGTDAFDNSRANGSLALFKASFDGVPGNLAVRHGDLEITVQVRLVLHLLNEKIDFRLLVSSNLYCRRKRVLDLILHKGHAVIHVIAQVNVFTLGDLALDLLELGNLFASLGELGGLAVPGHREAAVIVTVSGLLIFCVYLELRANLNQFLVCDDRRNCDAALGHGEGNGTHRLITASCIFVIAVSDIIRLHLQAVAVADNVILDIVFARIKKIAFLIKRNEVDF